MTAIRYELIDHHKVAIYNGVANNLEVARQLAAHKSAKGDEEPFFVTNLTTLVERFVLWKSRLPRVQPYYAVKCNNDSVIIRVLAELGVGFDCASKAEIDQILEIGLTPTNLIIYANPCKTRSFVGHASEVGVCQMTFDSAEELHKVKAEHSNPEMIMRIAIGDPNAQCPLSIKFGCDPPLEEGPKLLWLAKKLHVPVIGISFHVGSGCNTPSIFQDAIVIASQLFEIAKNLGHNNMKILDIGGGFPGFNTEKINFDEIVNVIQPCIDKYFPPECGVEIIAEPGRFFAAAPVSEVVNVIASTQVPVSRITHQAHHEESEKNGFMYYINDGVYGSFNCILFDHAYPKGYPLFEGNSIEEQHQYPTTIWGPTCDGLDQVEKETEMRCLKTGDWIYYQNMGAYTSAAATHFNGFDSPKSHYVIDDVTWETMFGVIINKMKSVEEDDETSN